MRPQFRLAEAQAVHWLSYRLPVSIQVLIAWSGPGAGYGPAGCHWQAREAAQNLDCRRAVTVPVTVVAGPPPSPARSPRPAAPNSLRPPPFLRFRRCAAGYGIVSCLGLTVSLWPGLPTPETAPCPPTSVSHCPGRHGAAAFQVATANSSTACQSESLWQGPALTES